MDSVTSCPSGGGTAGGGVVVEVWRERIYILHELSADRSDLFAQGGAEHHDLLLVRSHAEYLLDVSAHVWRTGQQSQITYVLYPVSI